MLEILYSDAAIAVIVKPEGLISEEGPIGRSVLPALRDVLGTDDIFPVHRLDRETGGVMVYARTKYAAASLTRALAAGGIEKTYLALVHGRPEPAEGVFEDLLFRDKRKNKSYVVSWERRGVRRASLSYRTLSEKDGLALVQIWLHTGRTHQIRVQFASRRMPLLGDGRYGAADGVSQLGLFACGLAFMHPESGARMEFFTWPAGQIWDGVNLDMLGTR